MNGPRVHAAALALTCAVALGYLATFADRGWIPADEGTIAQMAERVLHGELPHRDYDESYTGGLTYLHALGFRLLGVWLLSLRLVLYVFAALFLVAFFAAASRFVSPPAAGLATLVALVWSFPNYFASLPSWYVLVLTTVGALCLLRHVETGRRSWLFAAGSCGGVAMLAIVVGIYFVAAGVLFLFYREQADAQAQPGDRSRRGGLLPLTAASVILLLAALGWLLHRRFVPPVVLAFLLPIAALGLFVVWNESRATAGPAALRLRALSASVLVFGLGALLPPLLFAIPFAAAGSLPAVLHGVFALPQRRYHSAFVSPPDPETAAAALPYAALLLGLGAAAGPARRRLWWVGLGAVGLATVLFYGARTPVYRTVWYSARWLPVIATLAGLVALGRRVADGDPSERQKLFLLLSVAGFASLIQFPFAAPIYFCYAAPLTILAVLAILRFQGLPAAPHLAVAGFYLLFGVVWLNTGYVFELGRRYTPYRADARLDLPRAGLHVPRRDARVYADLVALIREKRGGGALYAGPDSPEVYFLADLPNPTRMLYDFLSDPPYPPGGLAGFLKAHGVTVVAINRAPDFSPRMDSATLGALEQAYPQSRELGRFLVRWNP